MALLATARMINVLHELGIGRDDRVGFLAPRGPLGMYMPGGITICSGVSWLSVETMDSLPPSLISQAIVTLHGEDAR